jgi:hypothetical protein
MNARNRLVNFRVTDEELRRLKTASTLQNARCLSDFARTVILDSTQGFDRQSEAIDPMTGELVAFNRRLARLESTVTRLVNALENADIFAGKNGG